MPKRVLLIGVEYKGNPIHDAIIETKGLCNSENNQINAAMPLYEYDVIIINPQSYSHFIFGRPTKYSDSDTELWDLKREDNKHDLDSVFYRQDREMEFEAAVKQGTRIIWLAAIDKFNQFFGKRSLYQGYLSRVAEKFLRNSSLHVKMSTKLLTEETTIKNHFVKYFEQLKQSGWRLSWNTSAQEDFIPLAKTPEGYNLGASIIRDGYNYWMLTPPSSDEATTSLIECALAIPEKEVRVEKYNGIFLSHNSEDKEFVRKLKKSLNEKGVTRVWVDEAEILIGDSLIQKIDEGLKQTEYFGIVLSSNSIKSPWVQKELEQAMMREISTKSVKVLPLLLEECELPPFIEGKLYANFTSDKLYEESLDKLMRRLEIRQ